MSAPETFIVRPEHILVGFFRAFFSQPTLFNSVPNEFEWVDNQKEHSLIIEMTGAYDFETPDAVPSIVIQEGGFNEREETMDRRVLHNFKGREKHLTNWSHSFILHCITRRRGTSKLLQAAVARSLSGFRKMIYQMGVEHIFPLRGRPPQRLKNNMNDIPGPFDSAIQLRMKMRQNWILDRTHEPEEKIRVTFHSALDKVELDEDGNPKNPDEVVTQELNIDNTS